MSLATELIENHINNWSQNLANTSYPYRKLWPYSLYRHERVENAAKILQSGVLLSRKQAEGKHNFDIAAPEVIGKCADAYDYVRLYFRPRNPTQYHIEGILKPEELYQKNENTHAPILVIFQFKAKAILTLQSVLFSDSNMQSNNKKIGIDTDFFLNIPFHHVYHEGAFDKTSAEGKEIIRARCAETLAPSAISLENNLERIVCRSPAERTTLLYLIGKEAENWQNKIQVFTDPGMFFSKKAYIQTVEPSNASIRINFHPREDGKTINLSIKVAKANNQNTVQIDNKLENFMPDKSLIVKPKMDFKPGLYLITIQLDNQIAYKANFLIDNLPF